ncbi:MAG TPA: AMP-binding protein [Methylomirabilota bacterium]|nr:AMP-binding protein [Methylomirabilota bacterium]
MSEPGSSEATLIRIFVDGARSEPGRPAMREREKGIWLEYTRGEVLGHVRALALGLHALGLRRDDKVAIISDNRPEAYWMIFAAQAVGAVPVPIYQDAIAREVQYVVDHSDARFVLAEDQEQVDKLVEARAGLPKAERVFYDDPKGLRHYDHGWLMPLTELEARGREVEGARPGLFDELIAAGGPDDVALIAYTSGTTGLPKGAMLTHRTMIAAAHQFLAREKVREGDELLSYLPIAWVGETAWSLALGTVRGLTVNFPEGPETVLVNLREIGPHLFIGPPRIWENSYSEIRVKIDDSSRLKRWVFNRFMPVGEEVARRRMEGRPLSAWLRLRWVVGELLLFAPLRDQRGARRLRYAFTGGAPLAHEIILFYRGLGVNLKQIYGQTENCAFCCGQPDDGVKLGTVGLPYPGVEIRLTEDGEIVSRSGAMFAGYYKSPEATREVIRDNWLYSGDAGFFDQDGHLVVVDRLKDVTRLADGTTLAPQFLENKLKFSPYVKEAVVVGPDRPYVAALVNIDMETVGKWAERRQLTYTTYTDLAQKPEVYDLVYREVERVNQDLPAATRIRKYVLLHKELDPDDEEMTRTRKVRRRVIGQKYARIIDALYEDAPLVPVTAEITYQDGRKAVTETKLAIRTVETRSN